MKYIKAVLFCLFDLLAVLYLLDHVSFSLATEILNALLSAMLSWNRCLLFRWTVIAYIGYRVGLFMWHRYKIQHRLNRKITDVLDKHGRLHDKLKNTPNPVISAEEVGELSIPALRERLASKKITAVDLIDAYQRRALQVFRRQPGCISEILFDSDVYAILADSKLETEDPSNLSRLHGIPVSVQEIFPVRGYDHTMGYTCRTDKPADEDCALVAALRNAGAIPFLLTNSRQKILGLTSENPIFGRTRHPTHPHRACVTGDSAALAHHSTPLSFAADILGDARLSAASCGFVSFKPTRLRMSQKGLNLPVKFPHSLGIIASPIGRTTEDVADAFRSLWTSALFLQDNSLCPIPFDESKFKRGSTETLRIGFYTGFKDLLPCSPAIERVMLETKHFLESKGHTVVEFTPPEVPRAYHLIISLFMNTFVPELLRLVYSNGHGDILVDYKQRAVHALYALPKYIKKILCYARAEQVKPHYAVTHLALRGVGCTRPYSELEYDALEYTQSFFEAWNEQNLDCLLCPVSPIPTAWDYSSFYVVNCVLLYTSLYNLLGCPAGTVAAGRVEKSDIDATKDSVKAGRFLRQSLTFAQQLDASEGLPINIQVVAKPWEDELALGLLKTIETGMKSS